MLRCHPAGLEASLDGLIICRYCYREDDIIKTFGELQVLRLGVLVVGMYI